MFHRSKQVSLLHRWRHIFISAAAVILAGCGGLAGEPEIIASLPTNAAESSVETALPIGQPSLTVAAQLYAENCIRCHGESGKGDGEFALSGELPVKPADFTDPALVRSRSPRDYFETITNGKMESLMPPWKQSFNSVQRWGLAFYTYTLHYQAEQIERGASIWASNCASCHGETGRGDGPEAKEKNLTMPDLTRFDEVLIGSDESLFAGISSGFAEEMPAFADRLSEQDRWDVIAYLRGFHVPVIGTVPEVVLQPASTEEASEITSAISGTIVGTVKNGTDGAAVPADLVVTLRIVDASLNEEAFETKIGEDGTFLFADVPMRSDRSYVTTTVYQGRIFASDLLPGDENFSGMDLPLLIYEPTSDPSVISISSMVVQFSPDAGSMQVAQIMSYTNHSDRLFSSDQSPDGISFESVRLTLPENAALLNIAGDTRRFIIADDQRTIIDTRPVVPGSSHLLHIVYSIPYVNSASLTHPLDYALDGNVQVLAPQGMILNSSQFSSTGTRRMGQTVLQSYNAALSLNEGDSVRYDLQGAITAEVSAPESAAQNNLLPLAMIFLGAAAMISAFLLYLRDRRPGAGSQQLVDALLGQIAELDQDYAAGQIDEGAYQHQRGRLKTRLAELMKNSKSRQTHRKG